MRSVLAGDVATPTFDAQVLVDLSLGDIPLPQLEQQVRVVDPGAAADHRPVVDGWNPGLGGCPF